MDLKLGILDRENIQDCKRPNKNDSGFDVRSIHDHIIKPGSYKMIRTGLFLDIPDGYEVQIRSRSGLAYKNGIFVLNSPGTIDCNYTGECNIILANFGDTDFVVTKGDRIAQFVLCPVPKYEIVSIDKIKKESRGGGFGHSGVK